MKDKSQTYSAAGSNADFRHYLAGLRRRSRCFSRKKEALYHAVKIFIHAYNQRQLYKHQYPNYNPSLMSFTTPRISPLPNCLFPSDKNDCYPYSQRNSFINMAALWTPLGKFPSSYHIFVRCPLKRLAIS